MPHYRRCLEQASFESHDSLVGRVGFKRRAKSASWLVVAVVGKNTTGMASMTDAPPIGVNVSPWRCCFNDNAVDYDDRLHRGLSTVNCRLIRPMVSTVRFSHTPARVTSKPRGCGAPLQSHREQQR
jgi:hypothetical protein